MSFRQAAGLTAAITLILLLAAVQPSMAGQHIVAASNSAEIRVSGAGSTDSIDPISGIREFAGETSSLFFNVEGSATGFEVFSVGDFQLSAEPTAQIVAPGSTLTLEEDPAFFGAAGSIEVYLAGDTSPNLIDVAANPAVGVPSYQTGNDGLASLDPAFAPIPVLLGTGNFIPTGAGSQTVVPLNFTGAAETAAVAAAQSGGVLRLLVTSGDPLSRGRSRDWRTSTGRPRRCKLSLEFPNRAVLCSYWQAC